MKATIIITVSLLFLSGAVFSQPKREKSGEAMEKLNLTKEQKESMRDIRSKTAKQMIDIRADLQKKRIDMQTLTDGDAPNRAAVEKLSREIGELQLQQKMALFDADQSVQRILNDDQKKIWKDIKSRKHTMMKERMMNNRGMRSGHGKGRGMGPGSGMGPSPEMGPEMGFGPGPEPEDDLDVVSEVGSGPEIRPEAESRINR